MLKQESIYKIEYTSLLIKVTFFQPVTFLTPFQGVRSDEKIRQILDLFIICAKKNLNHIKLNNRSDKTNRTPLKS